MYNHQCILTRIKFKEKENKKKQENELLVKRKEKRNQQRKRRSFDCSRVIRKTSLR